MSDASGSQAAPVAAPTLVFSRPGLGGLAHIWTTATVDLALLKIVEQFQFANHPAVRELDAKRAARFGGQLTLFAELFVATLGNIGRLI